MKAAFYIGKPILTALELTKDDDNRSRRLNCIADRYLEMVAAAMPTLTRAQWSAIMDANNGLKILGDLHSVLFAWANVADSAELGSKWSIDPQALAEQLRAMTVAEKIAVGEAIERFWAHAELPTDQALAKAGVKIDPAGEDLPAER